MLRSSLEGAVQGSRGRLKVSFEGSALLRHLGMRWRMAKAGWMSVQCPPAACVSSTRPRVRPGYPAASKYRVSPTVW
ncbi:hypothetical protein EBB05_00665 [Methylobacterium brachiatum]|nr:hypothetical protein EBB05_00665 [Methylobacterium brachiatum]